MNTIKNKIGIVLFFLGLFLLTAFLRDVIEEKPHIVEVEGKRYMRSKEYVGNGHFQIIMVPIKDSVNQ